MLRVISQQEMAEKAREELEDAMRMLAEAQTKVARAMRTLSMFEKNFRMGWYIQKPTDEAEAHITEQQLRQAYKLENEG